MPKSTLLLTALAVAAASTGEENCPCTTFFAGYGSLADDGGNLTAKISGNTYAYPARYGLSSCAAHDEALRPSCQSGASDG